MLSAIQYFSVALALLCALYTALSLNLLRITVAFFVEMVCVGLVLLSMGFDYLALVSIGIGTVTTTVLISFSTSMLGSLKYAFTDEFGRKRKREKLFSFFEGALIAIFLSSGLGMVLLSAPFVPHGTIGVSGADRPVRAMGSKFFGERFLVFEVTAVLLLVAIIGAALLLRRPKNAE